MKLFFSVSMLEVIFGITESRRFTMSFSIVSEDFKMVSIALYFCNSCCFTACNFSIESSSSEISICSFPSFAISPEIRVIFSLNIERLVSIFFLF
ncbi:MAG: hypothetical protein LBR13_03210 [Dysgonamonadaceae bacterium]|nr:hypothetical protein [Dysgonamonadaceae bacterium]